MRPAIQLYTLRHLDDTLPDVLRRVGDTAFEGVEFAGVKEADLDELNAALAETDLEAVSAHVGIEALEGSYEETVETYRALDCDRLVIPWLDRDGFESEAAAEATAARVNELAERVAADGFVLGYHNHDHEFVDLGDDTGFEAFVRATDSSVEIQPDVAWIYAAGHDPAAFIDDHADRIFSVHFTDVVGRNPAEGRADSAEIGHGAVEHAACVESCHGADVDWAIYEHDEPADPLDSLEHGAAVLTELTDG